MIRLLAALGAVVVTVAVLLHVRRAWIASGAYLADLEAHDEAVSDELLRSRLEAIARLAERHGYTPGEYLERVAGDRSPAT